MDSIYGTKLSCTQFGVAIRTHNIKQLYWGALRLRGLVYTH